MSDHGSPDAATQTAATQSATTQSAGTQTASPHHASPLIPSQTALAELTRLVRHLGDELASYRKRALSAEARLKQLDELAAQTGVDPKRSQALEAENAVLRERLEAARARTVKMLARVRFLRQQHQV